MEKTSGILENPILNYLPSKFEDLAGTAFFEKGGDKTRGWFKSKMNDADIFGSKDRYMPHQVAKWLGGVSKDTVNDTVGEADSSKLMSLLSNEGRLKRIINKGMGKDGRSAMIEAIRNLLGASHFSDPTDGSSGMGMSYSRMLGHALQAGGVTAAALTLPYVNKRRKQHRGLDRESELRKKSSEGGLLENVSSYLESNSPVDLAKGGYSPWKRNPLALPLAVIAAMGAYKGTKHGLLNITDRVSDHKMDERDEELRRQLSRLMVADNRSNEDGERVVKASKEKDNHGNAATNVVLPLLLAMWAGLIPPFYNFGKKLGADTSENVQYDKLVNAIDAFERDTPKSTKFQTGSPTDVLKQLPGQFLGSRNVVLPVPDKDRASTALNEIF